MAALDECGRQIIDAKILRPKVLTADQETHAGTSVGTAPDDALHVVGIAVNDAHDFL
jgi:hypothetical protein